MPKQWIYRECVVRLDVKKNDIVDEATFYQIQRVARGLTDLCVKYTDPYLGGTSGVSVHGLLHVSIFGFAFVQVPLLNDGTHGKRRDTQ